ncbi:MAG: hypothetical protein SFW67_33600 [Myxococcaceae bacterium]|nr:hypothetical protein [Myxococcaceae bacterium]
MKRLLLAAFVTVGARALADVPPDGPPTMPNTECIGKAVGARCGHEGTCEEVLVRRPDFSNGAPPTWKLVPVMMCINRAAPVERSSRTGPGLSALLAGLFVLLAARLVWARPRTNRPAAAIERAG